MNFKEDLKRRVGYIEDALERYLPPENAYPQVIHQAMRYSVLAGGKRLRPVLALAGCEVVGGNPVKVVPAACALEFLHTYSLIHDDLPAMDNDDYRRGKPTSHKVFGEAIAILAGDALLTLAFQLLAKTALELNSQVSALRVIDMVAQAAGTEGLIGGQVVDTIYCDGEVDEEILEYIHVHKTARLLRVSVLTGAVLAGGSEREVSALGSYGENMGLAFQIVDDILDIEGDADKIGKPVGSDLKNRKATYPALYGLDVARVKARTAAERAVDALKIFGPEADFLRELVNFILQRDR